MHFYRVRVETGNNGEKLKEALIKKNVNIWPENDRTDQVRFAEGSSAGFLIQNVNIKFFHAGLVLSGVVMQYDARTGEQQNVYFEADCAQRRLGRDLRPGARKMKFIPAKIIEAVKRYHTNRRAAAQKNKDWNKQADIDNFEAACKIEEISYWQASVGSFWITWTNGKQTLHNESNPNGVVVAKRIGKGKKSKWQGIKGVCFLTGKKEKAS